MRTRNGKIARLPESVRNEINERLDCSEPSPKLLAWLNALPGVQKILQSDFDGEPVTRQNLSQWRQGGFQEWLARRDLLAGVENMESIASDLDVERENLLIDDVASVLAARYAGLLANWNGEATPQFQSKAVILTRIGRGVVQLQRTMHQARKANGEYADRLEKQDREGLEERKKETKERLLAPVWGMLRELQLAKLFGGGTDGEKIAEYVVAVENGDLKAVRKLSEEDAAEAGKARKPAIKERPTDESRNKAKEQSKRGRAGARPCRGKKRAEATPKNARKSSPDTDLDAEPPAETADAVPENAEAPSKSVKVSNSLNSGLTAAQKEEESQAGHEGI